MSVKIYKDAISCMYAQCQNFFQRLSVQLIDVEGFYLNKFSDNSQNVYSMLILNILKKYAISILIIFTLLKELIKKI